MSLNPGGILPRPSNLFPAFAEYAAKETVAADNRLTAIEATDSTALAVLLTQIAKREVKLNFFLYSEWNKKYFYDLLEEASSLAYASNDNLLIVGYKILQQFSYTLDSRNAGILEG